MRRRARAGGLPLSLVSRQRETASSADEAGASSSERRPRTTRRMMKRDRRPGAPSRRTSSAGARRGRRRRSSASTCTARASGTSRRARGAVPAGLFSRYRARSCSRLHRSERSPTLHESAQTGVASPRWRDFGPRLFARRVLRVPSAGARVVQHRRGRQEGEPVPARRPRGRASYGFGRRGENDAGTRAATSASRRRRGLSSGRSGRPAAARRSATARRPREPSPPRRAARPSAASRRCRTRRSSDGTRAVLRKGARFFVASRGVGAGGARKNKRPRARGPPSPERTGHTKEKRESRRGRSAPEHALERYLNNVLNTPRPSSAPKVPALRPAQRDRVVRRGRGKTRAGRRAATAAPRRSERETEASVSRTTYPACP